MPGHAHNLVCANCRAVLANRASGSATFVAYHRREMILRGLAAVKCSCGESITLDKTFALPVGWANNAQMVKCFNPSCSEILAYRFEKWVIVSFRSRVYVASALPYVRCNECQTEWWEHGPK